MFGFSNFLIVRHTKSSFIYLIMVELYLSLEVFRPLDGNPTETQVLNHILANLSCAVI